MARHRDVVATAEHSDHLTSTDLTAIACWGVIL